MMLIQSPQNVSFGN